MEGMILPREGAECLARLEQAGYEGYAVGGCVRDLLMGIPPHDTDLTTSALPHEIKEVFRDCHCIETGIQHGTVTVLWADTPVEITTFRVDGSYADHRRPEGVSFTRSLREDLARRDLTVNALACDLRGRVVDFFGGTEDLQAGILRAVGDPCLRFEEDALRILRTVRFAAVTGFRIEEETEKALLAKAELLKKISGERKGEELCKLLCGAHAGDILIRYREVLRPVIPQLAEQAGFDQKNAHHCFDLLTHTARVVDAIPADPALRMAALLHDLGKKETFSLDEQGVGHFYGHAQRSTAIGTALMEELRFSTAFSHRVTELIRHHDTPIPEEETLIKKRLNRLGPSLFFDLLELQRADNVAQHPDYRYRQEGLFRIKRMAEEILERQECFSLRDLAISGKDLLEIGYSSGKELGRTLDYLLEKVMEGHLENKRESLLAEAEAHPCR